MAARPSVLGLARKETERLSRTEDETEKPAQKKRKANPVEEEGRVPDTSSLARRTRSQKSMNSSVQQRVAPEVVSEVIEDSQDDEDEAYMPGMMFEITDSKPI